MTTRATGALALLIAGSALAVVTLRASDMVGIYGVVEKTVLEPSAGAPQRVQVWGAFSLGQAKPGDVYAEPKRGYLYYTCPAGQESTCRAEWADLTSVAGKGQAVGFGPRFKPMGRLRAADEAPANPDPYPIEMGVTKLGSDTYHAAIADRLKTALKAR